MSQRKGGDRRTSSGYSRIVERSGSLYWKISGFSRRNCNAIYSSRFGISGNKKLFYLKVQEKCKDLMVLIRSDSEDEVSVSCTISIFSVHGRNNDFAEPDYKIEKKIKIKTYTSAAVILNKNCEFLPNDEEMTISCVLTMTGLFVDEKFNSDSLGSVVNCDKKLDPLTKALSALKTNKEFTDVVLRNKAMKFPAHKVLLMARSSVFESLLEEMGNDLSVLVLDMETKVLEELLNYIYTDECDFSNVDFGLKLLSAAQSYNITGLKTECVKYLMKNITARNVVDIVIMADSHGENDLCTKCMDYICDELSSVTFHATRKQKLISSPRILKSIIQLVATK